jgi:hypothetical protein
MKFAERSDASVIEYIIDTPVAMYNCIDDLCYILRVCDILAPRRESSSHKPCPKPEAPPVTRTTLPEKLLIYFFLHLGIKMWFKNNIDNGKWVNNDLASKTYR